MRRVLPMFGTGRPELNTIAGHGSDDTMGAMSRNIHLAGNCAFPEMGWIEGSPPHALQLASLSSLSVEIGGQCSRERKPSRTADRTRFTRRQRDSAAFAPLLPHPINVG